MDYNEIIKNSISNIVSNFYIIDVMNDKVLEYDSNYNLLNSLTFNNYVDNIKSTVKIEYLNEYFDTISFSRLEQEQNKGNKQVIYKYQKNINGVYKDYINIIKLISNNNGKLIMLVSMESNPEEQKQVVQTSDERIIQISDRVSDVILKIYNTIDTLNSNDPVQSHANTYIGNILSDLIRDVPELNKGYEKQIISEVNKSRKALMIVDDDIMTRNLIKKAFADEYEIIMAENGQKALDILEKNKRLSNTETRDNIVGIFLDLAMPVLDGFAVLDYLKINNILSKIPVIIISAAEEKETRQRVYKYGIADMLEKPFNLEIIKYRTGKLINLYQTSNSLNELILRRHDDLTDYLKLVIDSYLKTNYKAINYVKKITTMILTKLSNGYIKYKIDDNQINKIIEASSYYDLGYSFMPKEENSDSSLRQHTIIGSEIVKKVLPMYVDSDILTYAYEITKYHHENYDGTGFPDSISGENIPIYVQVASLAIEYTNMVFNNTSFNDICNEIIKKSGTKYNPIIIEIFKNILNELTLIN